jgi:hypothetical protein
VHGWQGEWQWNGWAGGMGRADTGVRTEAIADVVGLNAGGVGLREGE